MGRTVAVKAMIIFSISAEMQLSAADAQAKLCESSLIDLLESVPKNLLFTFWPFCLLFEMII